MKGIVYLIGAGPGDYKLLTIKGRECIEKASVIIYDYLADEKILRWARPDAEIIYAGKQANKHTLSQDEINALLVEKGLQGHVVARLKGGDPLVFGRGGEEALALRKAGIAYELVPGVTSGIAAPCYAGIPVTHRGVATSFAIVTGHEDPTKPESGMNWEHLAKSVDTLCFVMGVGNLPFITSKLIEFGRAKDMPAAVIRWGTKSTQEVLVSTLENIAEDVRSANIKPPAIFMVGDVVNLRDELRWFDNKPLFGKTIVVTRARSQASVLVEQLENLGANVLETPAIKTIPLELDAEKETILRQLSSYKFITFTSAQGVEYFFENISKLNLDIRTLGEARICAIGVATAKAIKKHGLIVDIIPEDYRAESLVQALQNEVKAEDRVLLIQPIIARSVIPEGLQALNVKLDILRLYKTEQDIKGIESLQKALESKEVDYITFTSSSTVTNTLSILKDNLQNLSNDTKIVCIGPITAATCMEHDLSVDIISEPYTIEAMVKAIVDDAGK